MPRPSTSIPNAVGGHEQDVYYVRVFPNRRRLRLRRHLQPLQRHATATATATPTATATATAHTDCYCYHSNSYAYSNCHGYVHSDIYSQVPDRRRRQGFSRRQGHAQRRHLDRNRSMLKAAAPLCHDQTNANTRRKLLDKLALLD